ncbi:rhodanese-like domain-containing protein [Mesonia aestuariivivens]|uniref:rhodanese-like domain-containing protein n=1 Tax=Mesonia aestuariivivens TaxID=2796128 RepID=UPI0034E19C3C
MKILINILFFVSFVSFSQNSISFLLERNTKNTIPFISVEQLKSNQKSFTLLDSWKKEEYNVSHLENAIWVGYKKFSAQEIQQKIKDKSTAIVIYCSLGIRSEKIGAKLKELGYTNVQNLYGGIFEWKNKGYPVFNTKKKQKKYTPSINVGQNGFIMLKKCTHEK